LLASENVDILLGVVSLSDIAVVSRRVKFKAYLREARGFEGAPLPISGIIEVFVSESCQGAVGGDADCVVERQAKCLSGPHMEYSCGRDEGYGAKSES
jgi:hypothetical protein